jgi:LysM repeat protein
MPANRESPTPPFVSTDRLSRLVLAVGIRVRTLVTLAALLTASAGMAAERPSVHVVQPGQKLASIAKRYGMSLDDLCQANGLRRSARIYPGQRLNIPSPDGVTSAKFETQGVQEDVPTTAHERPMQPSKSSPRPVNPSAASRYEAMPKRKGAVRVIGYHGDWQGQLVDRKNRLVAQSAASVSRILAWPHKDFRMNDRLLTLLAQVSDHFGGRPLRVVSGYRTTSWVEESKHPLGRACDFVVLGVPNKVLRDYLRTLDSVGVGYYPNSTFVHLDARDRNTYWVDYAGPGEPPRLTPTTVIPKDPSASADLQTEIASPASETVPPEPSSSDERPRATGVAIRSGAAALPVTP